MWPFFWLRFHALFYNLLIISASGDWGVAASRQCAW